MITMPLFFLVFRSVFESYHDRYLVHCPSYRMYNQDSIHYGGGRVLVQAPLVTLQHHSHCPNVLHEVSIIKPIFPGSFGRDIVIAL